jgi:hypothetical protein
MHPDSHDPYHSLPWLERLTVHVAGYDASLKRGDRRAADRTLRSAIVLRLQGVRSRLEEATRQLSHREDPSPSHHSSLERVMVHLDRVIDRIRGSDSRIESSYEELKVGPERASFLHAAHLALFEQTEALVRHFEEPDFHHDRLPHLEADLQDLEQKLDEKAMIYQKLA